MQYAKRQNVVSMLYLRDDLKIEMINLKTGDEKTVDAAKKPDQKEQIMRYLTFALTKGRLASKDVYKRQPQK